MTDDASQAKRAEPAEYERREPTIGAVPNAPAPEARGATPPRQNRIEANSRLLRGYELGLAQGEGVVDNVEVVDTSGLNQLLLTDRRLIVHGRDHQTIYPLRAITRLAVVKYIRWWMVLVGIALGAMGGIGAFIPTLLFPLSNEELIYLAGGLFFAGIVLVAIALLRPVLYVEIKSLGGDMKLRLTRNHEALAGFLSSLAQRIR